MTFTLTMQVRIPAFRFSLGFRFLRKIKKIHFFVIFFMVVRYKLTLPQPYGKAENMLVKSITHHRQTYCLHLLGVILNATIWSSLEVGPPWGFATVLSSESASLSPCRNHMVGYRCKFV